MRQAEDIFDMMINSQIQHAERVERSEQKLEHEQGFLRADTVTMNLVLEVLGKTLPSSSTSPNDILEKCDQILTKESFMVYCLILTPSRSCSKCGDIIVLVTCLLVPRLCLIAF